MRIAHILAAAVLALPLAACGSSDSGSDSGPINIGSVSSLSGAVTFPEASQAARAVFEEVNAKGGVKGRKIAYTAADDKGDPSSAALAARDVIQNKKAVALAGGASLVDCQVNGPMYQQNKITDVRGIGVDPGCFKSPNISPVNTGPFFGSTVTLYYASETLKIDKICAFFVIIGGTANAYKEGVERWSQITGKKLLINDLSLSASTTDYTPYVLRARAAGCKAVLFNGVEPMSIGWVKAAQAQKINDMKWLFLASTYTAEASKALGDAGKNVVALSEFEPYTEADSPANADWIATMKKHNVPLTAFAQGGYLAAKHLVTVLEGIKGDITRESVTEAMKNLKPLETPMTGMPFAFGSGDTHASNLAAKFVQPDGKGGWTVLTDQWIKLPNA
ncbi:amino acid/amide ABC transporter substrate-binding protein (HAAT family) [Actinomadura pelletieri DSM 43383]|uniref:Amino acid/amide ABC transporter substrate-binding protein (HAAT family) n=1 Tax=Actinomadura pelletieri DSM 43383 TaxID=1120940 RepID=A0A495QUW6_9ACTN|nr:ABC transporter substrate-binding protein [Actinomadura pelletieri]RKS77258.1 amino acid/amide ABC transporter substrate-binding protein (HAAT family) [Actinomadura pelletieri DSM 43383]